MKAKKQKPILTIIIFLTILLIISLLTMYHAQFISTLFANHFKKQCLWIILGIITFIILSLIPPKYFFKYSFIMYIINLILLFAVLFIGKNTNGAKAWLKIGQIQFQPSELMKLSYSLFLASFCTNRYFFNLKDELKFIIKVIIIFLLPSILVFLEPDTGAIIFFLLITIILLWHTKISKKWFFLFIFIISSILISFFYCYFQKRDLLIKILGTSFFYRVERVLSFGQGFQIENALTAIGSTSLFKFNLYHPSIYIPEAPTDFVFALSANIFGLIGPIIILICYLIIDLNLLELLKQTKNQTTKHFFLAFLTIFFFSQLENIGMNLGLFPIIGIPLPFLSYGGSFMIVLFAFLAIIFNLKKSFTKKSKTFKINYR